jgi:23S rRNA (guanine2445-N2)-methyltransferase / 23S rRNA (guanine2069-N7)-methyltransferase
MDFFATAAKGTEPALRDELRELRMHGVRADRGGVHFAGELEDGARACLHSRVAVRVLAWRGAFDVRGEAELYAAMRSLEWRHFLSQKHTLAVKATCRSSKMTHSQFIAQRSKDAIVDQLREDLGTRPNVSLEDPDVLVVVHLVSDRADVYVDLAGEPLHRRGWRTRIGEAPLKETLAAAMLRLAGWDKKKPLVDPMCGAGTIAIEAATCDRTGAGAR